MNPPVLEREQGGNSVAGKVVRVSEGGIAGQGAVAVAEVKVDIVVGIAEKQVGVVHFKTPSVRFREIRL